MKLKIFLFGLVSGWFWRVTPAVGQPATLSLSEAYALLESRYPDLQKAAVLEQVYANELTQLDIARRPMLFLKAEGRLQSESTHLDKGGAPTPFEIDQPLVFAKPYLEGRYLLYDGGRTEARKSVKKAQLAADLAETEVTRFSIRERINQLFTQIEVVREQSKLLDLSLENLAARKAQVVAAVEEGVRVEGDIIQMDIRILEWEARKKDLAAQMEALLQTLSYWTGRPISDPAQLVWPDLPAPDSIPPLRRPEQDWFGAQRRSVLAQSDLVEVQTRPTLAIFGQAGFGYPNPLNILDNNFSPYALAGVQFEWQIYDWKKKETDREWLTLKARQLDLAAATFDFNLESQKAQYLAEIHRLEAQIEEDQTLADLRKKLLDQVSAQLDEGVVTVSEYLDQATAELAARQQLTVHRANLRARQLAFWSLRGAFF
ncbi:MAG: TolC family protein [Bacteroidetes bacterium]|nr:MAG: TolC family protein [Bacteroidota bacterium]